MTVGVRVLGELEVVRDGLLVTPSQPKVRQLLALLAVNWNKVVRTEQLRTELWGGNPPPKASTTLQVYVSNIRRMLAGEPRSASGTVVHRPRVGYALNLPEHTLDIARFAELARSGRAELDAGRLEEASAAFRGALEEWRGGPLCDLDPGEVLAPHVARLRQERASVLEQRIEVDLVLGRHLDLIGELRVLVQEYPTHEGLHAKLMLALHRSGMRSEALSVFQRLRTDLIDQLGLEPSASTRRLHQDLLDGEVNQDQPPGSTSIRRAKSWWHPPAQLLPDPVEVIGRDTEAERIAGELRETAKLAVVTVAGGPGVGTSTLCAHVANQVRESFPDGQVYADLLAHESPGDVLAGFLRAIRGPDCWLPASEQERADLFRSWTARRRMLVVLDNVTAADQFSLLLPGGEGSAVLAGCRRRIADPNGLAVTLRPLSAADSRRLLETMIGAQVEREPDAATELAELCGGLPAALIGAATRLALRPHWSISRVVHRLRAPGDRLGELSAGRLDLLASVERTSSLLDDDQADAFQRFAGLFVTAVSVPEFARACLIGERAAESRLEQLVELQLIEVEENRPQPGTGYFTYRMHPLVRLAALAIGERRQESLRATIR
ncbi:AfsR/SARP family transcriptional regulator [Amycolatopsis sp. 195334CR]|uniref:AfsR/SARP family transcriptional regulator n=1 Tax=Amycolatopsis sp. 195334CR TaxID=2814588 RepID=UPI001A8FBC83|nr:AfsR/SARP family transcriptional regulator [Amycolatopsis sp. 195334CR]MBN6038561.1 winged helix-turn-helix domain-containing protein [Amycolatopsis sp. 195334CR]